LIFVSWLVSSFIILFALIMFDFFYDSLDTLRRVKKPSLKEVTELTIIIFIVVILSALIFALMDGVF